RSRNLLFELVVAGLLKRAGLPIRLDGDEDISFEFRNTSFFVECKRIHSTAKIQKNIDDAGEQIGKRCDIAEAPKTRGIIAIDVSKLIHPGAEWSLYPDLETFKSDVEQMLLTFKTMFSPQLKAPKEARVLGLYFYLRLPGQVLGRPGTHTVWKAGF